MLGAEGRALARGGRAASLARPRTGPGLVPFVHAVQLARELGGHHRVAQLARVLAAARSRFADQDAVAGVTAGLQPRPRCVHQLAVVPGRRGHHLLRGGGIVVLPDGLEGGGVVGLVPDRPRAHPGQALTRVAPPGGLHEAGELPRIGAKGRPLRSRGPGGPRSVRPRWTRRAPGPATENSRGMLGAGGGPDDAVVRRPPLRGIESAGRAALLGRGGGHEKPEHRYAHPVRPGVAEAREGPVDLRLVSWR